MNQTYIGGARSRSVGLGKRSPPSALNLTLASRFTRNVLTLPSTPRIAICITFQSTAVMLPLPFLGAASTLGTKRAADASATARRPAVRVMDMVTPLPARGPGGPRPRPVYQQESYPELRLVRPSSIDGGSLDLLDFPRSVCNLVRTP